MDRVPFELRSTYVCPQLEIPLNVAITQVTEWFDTAPIFEISLLWFDLENSSRARLLDMADETGELWYGQPLPDDALYEDPS